jgi:uncharacterized protein YdaU (DUF1376 family)
MHYYQHHIGDFIKDTTHLDDHQLATYLRMLWSYYTSESPISGDFEDVAFAMRTDEKTVRLLMRHFFTETQDGWHHTRCDKEIAEYHSKAEKARNSANARWKNADAMRTHSERNSNATVFDANQEPITNNHKPVKEKATVVATPHGVSDSVWQDFVKHRKAKKAQVTQTVIDGIQREADKAGWPLDAALRECITRNWQSFKADWVADKNLSQTGQMNQRVASGLTRGLIGGDNHVNLLGN